MPIVSKAEVRYDIMYKWATFTTGALGTVAALVYQKDRSRTWSRAFSSKKAAMVSLLQNGFLPTLPYQDDLQEIVNSKVVNVSGLMINQANANYVYGFVPVYNRTNVSILDAGIGSLTTNVQEQLQSKISGNGANLAVSAKEARQTVGMIGDVVGSLYKAYRHVRHGKFLAAAKALGLKTVPARVGRYRTPAENWLEYRYGWRLVVQDAYSLMTTLYDSLSTRPPLLRVNAMATSETRTSRQISDYMVTLPNGSQACKYTVNETVTISREVRGGYVYQLESAAIAGQQSFGILNPFTFAWEIIPWSFVVDWFVNIGSILEGLTAFAGKLWKDGWICKSIQSMSERFWTNPVKQSGVYTYAGPKIVTFGPQFERRFTRAQMAFTPSQIRIGVDLNGKRALDGIALLLTTVLKQK